ncbi:lycopene cyclase [Sphingobium sp. 22B]|uniref:lycopene beta-cyclase CrtY n=1 Tax=unclassified Sphingobium TaxID=2611147 RepID=UPI0007854791|nr:MULTISPECIES: lycopene beta-cyclase CrtY [unclassified Sphingobium]KXU29760.1 lycopene cyclase [Sphingobium sp. AM]KYC31688.1 lycopene cyclase [Sphingobium sp. 22B]OAP31012.1 lycopene cyclase [Sphingobium sp. 20006FA]PNP99344.1 lycopene cyclase [Sphingobium sp. SA916]
MATMTDCDVAIVGGGLAGCLTALALAARHPHVSLRLLESGDRLGGNHIWSFFDSDVDAGDRWLVEPLIAHRWPEGYEVRFPGHCRQLAVPYNSITSARLDAHVRERLGDAVLTGAQATGLTPTSVTLSDGRVIRAKAVLDARGGGDLSALRCGWQKFVGQTLRLHAPHGLSRPVIMDATVEQMDGYRFVYLLPWDERTVFVEDTYYSDTPDLDVPMLGARIAAYARARDWQVEEVVHSESGVLPVVHGGDFDRFWPHDDPVARLGARAALFQPMTGYSLPDAVRFALRLANEWPVEGQLLAQATRGWARDHWRQGAYYRLLGRMLFGAARPDQRWRIFERFYRLDPSLIGRFYAGRSTLGDRIRILCGRPPVPIRDAMRALLSPPA